MISEIFKRSYFGLGEKDVYSYFAIFFVIFIYDPIAALYFSIFCKLFLKKLYVDDFYTCAPLFTHLSISAVIFLPY